MTRPEYKVVWSQHEWERLAIAAAPHVIKGMHPLEAYRYVMPLVFEKEPWRVRTLRGMTDLKNGKHHLETKIAAGKMAGGQVGPAHQVTRPIRQDTPVSEVIKQVMEKKPNGALPEWMEAQIEAEAEKEAGRLRAVYQQKLSDRIRQKLGEEAPPDAQAAPAAAPQTAASSGQRQEPHPKHNPEPMSDRAKHPKVVLVGVWPQLRAVVNKEFSETLDLRWFENNRNDWAVIERHVRNSDFAITPDGVHGEIPNMVRRAAKKYESVHGSASALVDRLTKFVVYGK